MNTGRISTLRPGLLVSLKTSISGNVSYKTKDLEREHVVAGGAARARWETERTVKDRAELQRATKARAEARWAIMSVCARSSFGLLCPDAWEKQLTEAIAKARKVADEFNRRAKHTDLSIYVIVGRIADDDVEAVKAINSEVRDLMNDMAAGVKELDTKRIRDAALKARAVGGMLTPEASEKVKAAIDAARAAARKIVKAGETAAKEVDREAIKQINSARTAFLDLDAGDVLPVKPLKAAGRAIDLAPEEAPAPKKRAATKKKAQPARKKSRRSDGDDLNLGLLGPLP